MTNYINIETQNRVLIISLDRPEQLNALTHDMYSAIANGLRQAATQDDIRAIIITGRGEAFTAGNDLGDFAKPMPDGKPPVVHFLETLRDIEKPVLAAVNGPAIGIGLTMLLHCDLSFAADTASFRAPFAHVGLVPEAGSSLLLPRALGTAWANDILLGGRTLTAEEALSAGLISRIFPESWLFEETLKVATEIATQAPIAMRKSKALIRNGRDALIAQMGLESTDFAAQLKSHEFAEAVAAFTQRRDPVFE